MDTLNSLTDGRFEETNHTVADFFYKIGGE